MNEQDREDWYRTLRLELHRQADQLRVRQVIVVKPNGIHEALPIIRTLNDGGVVVYVEGR